MESDINIHEHNTGNDKHQEYLAAYDFKIKIEPITVTEISANLIDDFNAEVSIKLSNNDSIDYILSESRLPVNGQIAPPYYTEKFIINNEQIDIDEAWLSEYTNGTLIGSILNYYKSVKVVSCK